MLELHAAQARWGDFVLGPISLQLPAGVHHLIIGPSGAGKSLLLRVLAGLHPLHAGSRHAAGGVAWVGQRAALFGHMSVHDNIAFGLRCQGMTAAQIPAQVTAWAERLGVAHLLQRRPAHLSAGEQQRVALARALAPGFPMLLLDESFSALDRGARLQLYACLDALCAERGLGIVHVTHDIDVFLPSSLAAFALVAGSIVQAGTVRAMLDAPHNAALAAALGAPQSSSRFTALK